MRAERKMSKMDCKVFVTIMNQIEALKYNTRHSWTSTGRHESVAEHSWRLSIMAYFVKDEFPEVDISKVIQMAIFHDLGEAFTGDIPSFYKTSEDEERERNAIWQFIRKLPEAYQQELFDLFKEMEEQKTMEAKIYKALDKMEAVIQHNEAPLSTWIEREYQENLIYGEEQVQFSDYFKELKNLLNEQSQEKIRQGQKK